MNDAPAGGAGPTSTGDRIYREPAAPAVSQDLIAQVVAATTQAMEARARRPSPFDLNTFEEIENFCDRVTRSNLCPKDYKGKPDDAIVAVLKGKEVGLPPMAALESICVINGRPSIYGDAVPGLCMQTGQVGDVVERFEGEGEGDALTAVCIVTRKGMTTKEGRFSAADVARAGLKNVHLQYPRDMMMWRARHRAWHGAFPDVLKGLGTAELEQEAADAPQWTLGRPDRSWFSRSTKKRGDPWDDKWFGQMADKLIEETNAWKLLELLRIAGETAPSQRDLDELRALGCVEKAYESAPPEAKAAIDEIFAKGKERLAGGAKDEAAAKDAAKTDTATGTTETKATETSGVATSQEGAKTDTATKPPAEPVQGAQETAVQSTVQEPGASDAQDEEPDAEEFEAYVFDESGEPDMAPIVDPLEFATRIVNRCLGSKPDAIEAILAHNADGIADAKAISPKAAEVLAQLDDSEQVIPPAAEVETPQVQIVHPPADGSRETWRAWIGVFRERTAEQTAATYPAFADAHQQIIAGARPSEKLLAVNALKNRAEVIGIEKPAWLDTLVAAAAQAGRAAAKADDGPAATTGSAGAPQAEEGVQATDADNRAIDGVLSGLLELTSVMMVQSHSQATIPKTLHGRLTREGKVGAVKRLERGFEARIAALKPQA